MKKRKKTFYYVGLFCAGFLISYFFLFEVMSEEQFQLCEQVAQQVYEQRENVIVEAPEELLITKTVTTITVEYNYDLFHRGNVVAKLKNGELVTERNHENGKAIFVSVLLGIIFLIVGYFILQIINEKHKMKSI